MFATGVHAWLYSAAGCYFAASALCRLQLRRTGRAVLFSGFIIHSLYLLGRGWLSGIFVPNAIFEGPFFLPWCLAAIASFQALKKNHGSLLPQLVLTVASSVFAIFYAKGIIPPTPRKVSVWALLFFISEIMAHALFYTGAVRALVSVWKKETANGYYSWIVWGFVVYTVAQVTGAVWGFLGWGNTFSWGARHLGSATIWTFYAACLHLKFIPGWRKSTAVVTIAGAVLVLFISYGHYVREMSFLRIGG